jgi:hypothetical protein
VIDWMVGPDQVGTAQVAPGEGREAFPGDRVEIGCGDILRSHRR